MSSALMRGRTLDRRAVRLARDWRDTRLEYLLGKHRLELTFKERDEARRLTGRWNFWEEPPKQVYAKEIKILNKRKVSWINRLVEGRR